MRLVLHPGHSKCGSTTIQKAIIKNRHILEGNGYIIPDPQMRTKGDSGFNPNGETPRPFFRNAMENQDISNLKSKLRRIKEKFSGGDVSVLISAENLVNQLGRPSGIQIHKELAGCFSDHKVLYYIRRRDQFIMSAWQQWGYKQGVSLREFTRRSMKVRNPNYRVSLEKFGNVYGEGSVNAIPLSDEYLKGNSLVIDFFDRLGITQGVKSPGSSIENKSLNPYICEALSKVKHLFKDIHDESIKIELEKRCGSQEGLFSSSNDYLSPQLRNHILSNFRKDNEIISNEYVGGDEWLLNDDDKKSEEARRDELLKMAQQAVSIMAIAFSSQKLS